MCNSEKPTGREPFNCQLCSGSAFESAREFSRHLNEEHGVDIEVYVFRTSLHRCAVTECNAELDTLTKLICDECKEKDVPTDEIRIPCRFCGKKWASVDDPFCSPECARKGIAYGSPLEPPSEVDEQWLDGTYRFKTGIPNTAPLLENSEFPCYICNDVFIKNRAALGSHLRGAHDISTGEFAEKVVTRECRVCGELLDELDSYYCSDSCRLQDDDPPNRCEYCGRPAKKGRIYCSENCGYEVKVAERKPHNKH